MFLFPYETFKNSCLLPNHQNFLCQVCEVSLTWFLLVSIFKKDASTTSYNENKTYAVESSAADHVISEWR